MTSDDKRRDSLHTWLARTTGSLTTMEIFNACPAYGGKNPSGGSTKDCYEDLKSLVEMGVVRRHDEWPARWSVWS